MTADRDFRDVQEVVTRIRTRFRKPADFARLTPSEQLIFRLAVVFDGEMRNGGIDQYLRNQSGDTALEVATDLQRIKATRALKILLAAAEWFSGARIPTDQDARFDALIAAEKRDPEAFAEKGDALSRQYLVAADELYRQLLRFIQEASSDLS